MGERVLDRIIAHKRAELAGQPPSSPRRQRPMHSLRAALGRAGTRVIYEFKRASPSGGTLYASPMREPVVCAYSAVADAVSVLTDGRFFGGSLDDLRYFADRFPGPVLCKDFIIDPAQVAAAHAHGADAVLLMLSVLDDAGYRTCARTAHRLGVEVLAEVHDRDELERALALDAEVIGINNRSFADLSVDPDTTRDLAPRIPAGRLRVAESGVGDRAAVCALAPLVDAFLIGSALMRAPRIDLAARHLVFGDVKVCGLTRPADAVAAWRAGAVWGGVLFTDSPRRVDAAAAREIAAASPLPLAGVFTDSEPAAIRALVDDVPLAAVQLHGAVDEARIAAVRAVLPRSCELWHALRVDGVLPPAPAGVDRVLYDGSRPGTGRAFDWSLLAGAPPGFGLAGGIDAGNVGAALATGAALLDVSSGVEAAPGVKSTTRLDALFTAIRVATGDGFR